MNSTFSGSSRRPRQVNLSGRVTSNPFNKPSNTFSGSRSTGINGPQADGRANALLNAQHDRVARQQERDRTHAATLVQKRWRGNAARKDVRLLQRSRWDQIEQWEPLQDSRMEGAEDISVNTDPDSLPPYESEAKALSQLWMLLRFVDLYREDDFSRLERFFMRLKATTADEDATSGPWPAAYLRLQDTCLSALERLSLLPSSSSHKAKISFLMIMVLYIDQQIPPEKAQYDLYYRTMAVMLKQGIADQDLIMAPLKKLSPSSNLAYEQLALHVLILPEFYSALGGEAGLKAFAAVLNCKILGKALADRARNNDIKALNSMDTHQRSWLLGYVIFFYRQAFDFLGPKRYSSDKDFVLVVATLLSSLIDEIEIESAFSEDDADLESPKERRRIETIHPFVHEQITSLVNQESVGNLLSFVDSASDNKDKVTETDHSRILASYILTLLRLFPRRADEIRMWLYLGMSSGRGNSKESSPVIYYFWQATSRMHVFQAILSNPRAAIDFLKAARVSSRKNSFQIGLSDVDDQWRVILIFIELYMFVLKVMDDEEFFRRASENKGPQSNSLSLKDVEHLTTFLKHLGFTMYYNVAEITRDPEEVKPQAKDELFRPKQQVLEDKIADSKSSERTPSTHIAGLQGISLDYVKGMVTGLLRSLYERDSRRPFLPTGHWLMTSRFDMTNFIDAVVAEEERRHQVQEEEDDDNEDIYLDSNGTDQSYRLVGTNHAQRVRATARMQREQRKASRKRYLQAVAPRLEILQNMPFLIPFSTRVKIFRRFVHLDQEKRRFGVVDGEMWRLQQMHDPNQDGHASLARHHAKIRRGHEFDDAFAEFNHLGVELKEPIQITFVDQFDAVEAGIDGGGVTKEFLTSVTNQAFAPTDGIKLFAENDQHLLYPNPSAVEEQKEILREAGFQEDSPEFRLHISELLQRYEFLGRVIGKCLYEGILIDISFANFFLLKWALTGGTGSAPRESGYRANLNDLRDFDEGLYQGLLQLKNYTGNVEDFSLNFTVTDTLEIPGPHERTKTKTITRELKPGGSSIPVTNSNRLVYISYMARHRLQSQPFQQSSAFLTGLATIIQPSWLSMFNQSELQTLVGGAASQISIPDLRANTIYGGLYVIGDDGQEHPSVKIFWNVMESLDDTDRRKVLKFVTSTPRAPLLGFSTLNPRFCIRDSGDERRLPSTSTCVNLLKLPIYKSPETCKTKLLQAVNSGAGFDLS